MDMSSSWYVHEWCARKERFFHDSMITLGWVVLRFLLRHPVVKLVNYVVGRGPRFPPVNFVFAFLFTGVPYGVPVEGMLRPGTEWLVNAWVPTAANRPHSEWTDQSKSERAQLVAWLPKKIQKVCAPDLETSLCRLYWWRTSVCRCNQQISLISLICSAPPCNKPVQAGYREVWLGNAWEKI